MVYNDWLLNGTCNRENSRAGCYVPFARGGILRIDSGGDGDIAGCCDKETVVSVVGVVDPFRPYRSVISHGYGVENGIKGVADRKRVGGISLGVAEILNREGVGQLSVFTDGLRIYALCDSESGRVVDGNGFLRGNASTSVCDGGGVVYLSVGGERSEVVYSCLVYEKGIAACGNGYS